MCASRILQKLYWRTLKSSGILIVVLYVLVSSCDSDDYQITRLLNPCLCCILEITIVPIIISTTDSYF